MFMLSVGMDFTVVDSTSQDEEEAMETKGSPDAAGADKEPSQDSEMEQSSG